MTELGDAMLNAQALNNWLGTSYTPEQAADLDWLVYVIFGAVKRGMEPEPKD